MKSIIKRTLPLLFIPFLAGCVSSTMVVSDKTTSVASIQNMKAAEIYFSCQKCVGEIQYRISVKESNSLTITNTVNITEGTVEFTVKDANGNELFQEEVAETKTLFIALAEYGKHAITINHTDFKGNYRLNWALSK